MTQVGRVLATGRSVDIVAGDACRVYGGRTEERTRQAELVVHQQGTFDESGRFVNTFDVGGANARIGGRTEADRQEQLHRACKTSRDRSWGLSQSGLVLLLANLFARSTPGRRI